ncbi:velvet factor [Syncephalis fuscata]|nr:velvet factor [Syncephalis fuscata]
MKPAVSSSASVQGRKMWLEIVQHPLRARMCGFGEKDRRPVDPPPVVRLHVVDADGKPDNDIDSTMFVVHADLWCADGTQERNLVVNPSYMTPLSSSSSTNGHLNASVMRLNAPPQTRNLLGSVVSSAYHLQGPNGKPGIYFVFQDLSVRTEGTFSLKFAFTNLECAHNGESRVEMDVFSRPFTVYPPKKFPGMTESTAISKCLAKQGIKIPIRKELRTRRGTGDEASDDNGADDQNEVDSPPGPEPSEA